MTAGANDGLIASVIDAVQLAGRQPTRHSKRLTGWNPACSISL